MWSCLFAKVWSVLLMIPLVNKCLGICSLFFLWTLILLLYFLDRSVVEKKRSFHLLLFFCHFSICMLQKMTIFLSLELELIPYFKKFPSCLIHMRKPFTFISFCLYNLYQVLLLKIPFSGNPLIAFPFIGIVNMFRTYKIQVNLEGQFLKVKVEKWLLALPLPLVTRYGLKSYPWPSLMYLLPNWHYTCSFYHFTSLAVFPSFSSFLQIGLYLLWIILKWFPIIPLLFCLG